MQTDQKVAIITGGAQGIGKGIAIYFLEQNMQVIIVDNDKQAGNDAMQELKPLGDIRFFHGDVADESDVKAIIVNVIKAYGKIDYLVNNAGIMIRKPVEKLSLKEWNKVISVNLTSIFLWTKYAARHLKKSNGGIVNIASTRALMSEPNTESYSASKGGVVALTHSLAISLGPKVRVNCISPGWIEVSEWKKKAKRHSAKLSAKDLDQHPVGRVGNPHDIAALACYLLSADAGFITGANFVVDGGMTRKMIYEE